MRHLSAGVMAAVLMLGGPAYSQQNEGKPLTGPEELQKKQREEAAEVEKAYKATIKNTGSNGSVAKQDPWGNVRSTDTTQAKQNPSSKATK
jgi:hypothetical protein